MTMLKGYAIPAPGAGDGEYGGFGDFGASRFAGYAQSPADRPYWQGQGIANTIPALNGYGLSPAQQRQYDMRRRQMQQEREQVHTSQTVHGYGDPVPSSISSLSLTPTTGAVGGAIAGWLNNGVKGAVIGGLLGYFVGEKLGTPAALGAYGNEIVGPPPGEKCPPGSGSWCSDYLGTTSIPGDVGGGTVKDALATIGNSGATVLNTLSTGVNSPSAPGSFPVVPAAIAAFLAWKFVL